jgi:hypothetical protein
MKRIKISVSLLAIVLGLSSVFAFKAPERHATNQYWLYNGTGDPTAPGSYTETTGDGCSGNTSLCEILAPASGSQPVISSGLKTRIQNLDTRDNDVFLQD